MRLLCSKKDCANETTSEFRALAENLNRLNTWCSSDAAVGIEHMNISFSVSDASYLTTTLS